MKKLLKIFLVLILMIRVGELSAKEAGLGAAPSRLSFSPTDFLKKGFRTAPWVKDPFFPETNELKLTGLISQELAFINGKWLREGDVIEGYIVKSINPGSVTLAKNYETLVLKMQE